MYLAHCVQLTVRIALSRLDFRKKKKLLLVKAFIINLMLLKSKEN